LMARQGRAAEARVYYQQALDKCRDPAQRAAIGKKIAKMGE
jgi:predicted RNA polymerase sigma factor